MANIATFFKVAALIPILVGVLHLVLGLNADVLLGANLPAPVIADPVLDSQNRFYGVAFMLYGVCLFLGGSDLKRYLPVCAGHSGYFSQPECRGSCPSFSMAFLRPWSSRCCWLRWWGLPSC
jgi:hypothetical protein